MTEISREDLLSAKEWLDFIDTRQINHAWHTANSKTIRYVLNDRINQVDVVENKLKVSFKIGNKVCDVLTITDDIANSFLRGDIITIEVGGYDCEVIPNARVTNNQPDWKVIAEELVEALMFYTHHTNFSVLTSMHSNSCLLCEGNPHRTLGSKAQQAIAKYEQAIKGDGK